MGKRRNVEHEPARRTVCMTLESMGDINDFRVRARELGVPTRYRNAEGHWVNRHKEDMVKDCQRQLKESQGRDAIRALAVQLGVKRYKASVSTGRTTWRKAADLVADCDKVLEMAKKGASPVLFDKQFDKQRGVVS